MAAQLTQAGGGDGNAEPVAASAPDEPLKLPKGVMVIDEQAWAAMGTRAKAGEEALARMRRADRDTVIAAAVKDGKFSVDQVAHYDELWDQAPEATRSLIASMRKNVVPVADTGIPGLEEGDVDTEYEALFGKDGQGAR